MAKYNRSRSRTIQVKDSLNSLRTYTIEQFYDYRRVPKPKKNLGWNECARINGDIVGAKNSSYKGHYSYVPNCNIMDPSVPFKPSEMIKYADITFDFTKNNTFEIIPFVYELDETLAMFSLDFIKSFNYGAYNWGLNPFIMDLKGILNSVKDLIGGIDIEKEITKFANQELEWDVNYNFTHNLPVYGATYRRVSGTFSNVKLRTFQSVFCELPDLDPHLLAGAIFLDEIGLHPDLKTIWDVTPLAFVVDYFFPIGDILDSIHPRGWFNPTFNVKGPYTLRGKIDCTGFETTQGIKTTYDPGVVSFFYRSDRIGFSHPTNYNPPVTWQAPSIRELFNTLYIAKGFFD